MQRALGTLFAAATLMSVAACTDYESATNLHPDGPPKVQQVRMRETYTTPGDSSTSSRRIFAFGTHPNAIEVDQHSTQSAALSNNGFRIIMDELLVGNNLEEIGCRSNIDGDAYSRVPVGTTPDDIARCATAQDVLPSTCQGQYATCICQLDAGCSVGTTMIPKGGPVGVDDKNQDGAADDTHMIVGSVGIKCGAVNVPIDINMSYWNPSGNQQPPAMGGFEALGPAIVLVPERGLPSNLDCSLVFADDVVDKQNVKVCAPPNGDPDSDCNPGDTAAVKFKTEPMNFQSVTITMPGTTGVSRIDAVVFVANTTLDPMAINGITVTAGGAAFTNFTVALSMNKVLTLTPTGTGFPANSTIVVTLTSMIKDNFAQPLPTPLVVSFMTGP
jgi:hypothetical protein